MPFRVLLHPDARRELGALAPPERRSLENAIEKRAVLGDQLGAPHGSSVRGASDTLRELRPRAGRSRWRAFYRRIGDHYVIAAVGPQAMVDQAGFRRSVADALARLASLTVEHEKGGST